MTVRSLFQDYCSLAGAASADWSESGIVSPWEAEGFPCPFCGDHPDIYTDCPSDYLSRHPFAPNPDSYDRRDALVLVHCWICGWWELRRGNMDPYFKPDLTQGYRAKIHEIDISESDVPVNRLARYLVDHWSDRRHISPSAAEDITREILRDHFESVDYYSANVFAADQGIDLAIGHQGGEVQIAVQIKRRISKDVESVSAVREFLGALAHSRFDKGILVTTARRFSLSASEAAASPRLKARRLELSLIDGERLLELLRQTVLRKELRLPSWISTETNWYHWDDTPHPTAYLINRILPEEFGEKLRHERVLLKLVAEIMRMQQDFQNDHDTSKLEKIRHLHERLEAMDKKWYDKHIASTGQAASPPAR